MNPFTPLPRVPLLNDRRSLLLERSCGKRVLHLGCVDAGLLRERFAKGDLLHSQLAAVASTLWGVDIDNEGIEFLRNQGFEQLIAGDVSDPNTLAPLRGLSFDVVIASEVVEHLLNPGLFLDATRTVMTPGQTELIMTVPNAFRVQTLLHLLRGVEYVHPDHNYWFSYVTATNLLRKTNFEIVEVYAYTLEPRGILRVGRLRRDRPMRPGVGAVGPAASSQPPAPTGQRLATYLRSLPRRILTSLLYRTTPFWGDGLILIAKVPRNG